MRSHLIPSTTLVILSSVVLGTHAAIIGVEVSPISGWSVGCPVGSDAVYSVAAPPYPLNTSIGIGHLIDPEPAIAGNYALLSGIITSATVTYRFDQAVTVDQLEIVEHFNGVTRVEGFVGDDLGSLVSIGNLYSDLGDVNPPNGFTETAPAIFDFDNTTPATYFRFVTTEHVRPDGWAIYQAFPRTADGARILGAVVPEPATLCWAAGLGLAGFALGRRLASR